MALLLDQFVATESGTATLDLIIGQTLERVGLEKGLEFGRDLLDVLVVNLLLNLDIANFFVLVANLVRSRLIMELNLFTHGCLSL